MSYWRLFRQVLDELDVPVSPDRIVYANTVKERSHIRYAAQRGVQLTTFDSEQELVKIKSEHPAAQLLVRIAPPPSADDADVGSELAGMDVKFGCRPAEAVRLLSVAARLGLLVVGVSFYAGHRCYDPSVYLRCIAAAKMVFDASVADGRKLEVLDVGGGFYGDRSGVVRLPFTEAAAALRASIDQYFAD